MNISAVRVFRIRKFLLENSRQAGALSEEMAEEERERERVRKEVKEEEIRKRIRMTSLD